MAYYEGLLAGYEAWKKTPEGKKFKKESEKWVHIEIKDLPDGWELEDGGVKEEYFVYYNADLGIEIYVQEHFDFPCWQGGYPKFHFIEVGRKDEDDIEEGSDGVTVAKFSVHELGWDEAYRQANERALAEMESLSLQ